MTKPAVAIHSRSKYQPTMIYAEIRHLESNDYNEWSDFARYESPDPYDDFGWFHVTICAFGKEGGNDFQVCVSTPRAVGKLKRTGSIPGILVDRFDADTVRKAIYDRVTTICGHTWEQIVDQLREFLLWEFEGMAGS